MRIPVAEVREAFIAAVEAALRPLQPSAIYLFGSHGTPHERSESDIDLAFLCKQALPSRTAPNLAETLTQKLGKEVDLIDLNRAALTLRSQIVGEGECLICHDEMAKDLFEMYTLSDYARLNEERAPILNSIRDEIKNHE